MSVVIGVGGSVAKYGIKIDDPFGNPLFAPKDWISLEWSRAESAVGALTLTIPGHWPAHMVKQKDGIIEVWRQVGNGVPKLLTETLWLRRGWKKIIRNTDNGIERLWELRAFDLNHLLWRRFVDYNAGNGYTLKYEAADDMIKSIADENLGAGATDATRAWTTYLDIQSNRSLAPNIVKSFARRRMIEVLAEICQTSTAYGTYLAFDVVCKTPPSTANALKCELRTYTGQRGMDHTFPGGNPPILLGTDFGNMRDVELDESYEEEVTRGIVGGQGDEEFRPMGRYTDTARVNASPFGLIESFSDSNQDNDAAGLVDEARGLVQRNALRKNMNGQMTPTSGLLFDVNFGFGDTVTAQADGDSFDAHIDRLHGTVERNRAEQIEAWVRAAV